MPMDRLYSGIPLAKWLLSKKKVNVVETHVSNCTVISEWKIWTIVKISPNIFWSENSDTVLLFYTVKSNSGENSVLLLATMGPLFGITKVDDKKKLA